MKEVLFVIGALLVGGAVAAPAGRPSDLQTRSQRIDHQSGAYLFRVFCISCHGESGKGDGPVAELLNRPPGDLGRIAIRAGGIFPRDTVIRKIDGRLPVPAHAREDMPIWGEALKITEGQDERIVRQRIEALASHIESIQAKNP